MTLRFHEDVWSMDVLQYITKFIVGAMMGFLLNQHNSRELQQTRLSEMFSPSFTCTIGQMFHLI